MPNYRMERDAPGNTKLDKEIVGKIKTWLADEMPTDRIHKRVRGLGYKIQPRAIDSIQKGVSWAIVGPS